MRGGQEPAGGPRQAGGGAQAGPSPRGRRAAAVALPVVTVAVLVAMGALLLTGTVKFGAPAVTAVTLASKVDSAGKPLDSRSRFTGEDERVYCCANVRAFASTRLESKWYGAGVQVSSTGGTFGGIAGTSPVRFATTRGRVCFALERPADGWVAGPYSVKVLLDGRVAGRKDFMVRVAGPEGMAGIRYRDPSGAFSIVVPEGWRAAEESSLGGALAGFLAPSSPAGYIPGFAVSLTDFESAGAGYLNKTMNLAPGAPDAFVPYSIGELAGARRTFEWDYDGNGEPRRLRSVQVVVETGGGVFSVDCHSLASDFPLNEPTFNAVINTIR